MRYVHTWNTIILWACVHMLASSTEQRDYQNSFFLVCPAHYLRCSSTKTAQNTPKKSPCCFSSKIFFLNPGWPSYCIRRYLNTQRCTWPPENLIFQVVTEMLPTESKSQRQIGPYIIALLQNYSFLCCSSRHWKKAAAFLGPVRGNTSLDQQSEVFHIKMRWLLIISDVRGTI